MKHTTFTAGDAVDQMGGGARKNEGAWCYLDLCAEKVVEECMN
jgi:hypothetical protein